VALQLHIITVKDLTSAYSERRVIDRFVSVPLANNAGERDNKQNANKRKGKIIKKDGDYEAI